MYLKPVLFLFLWSPIHNKLHPHVICSTRHLNRIIIINNTHFRASHLLLDCPSSTHVIPGLGLATSFLNYTKHLNPSLGLARLSSFSSEFPSGGYVAIHSSVGECCVFHDVDRPVHAQLARPSLGRFLGSCFWSPLAHFASTLCMQADASRCQHAPR